MEIISRKEAIEKGLKRYFTGKPCKYGHVSERRLKGVCLECEKEYMKEYYGQNKEQIKEYREQNKEHIKEYKKEYDKEYRAQNKEHIKEYKKEYYEQNKEYFNEYFKEYRAQNKEYKKEYDKEYREQNKEQINEYMKEYFRNRYATDESYKTGVLCRSMLQRTLKATNSTKDTRTYEMLGYCNEQLKEHIEYKFLKGMSWDNYGDWHIDHIYPVSRYIKDGVEDPAVINHLDNLIPMWEEDNLEKSDRTLEEYLDDRKDLVELYGRFL